MTATNAIQHRDDAVAEPKGRAFSYSPRVDMVESNEAYRVLTDIPGARAEDLDVQYEDGVLSIHACVTPRQPPGVNYMLREYGVGDFHREFRIGEGVDHESISAELNNGVLTLTLPKAATVQRRRIEVQGK